MSGEDEKLLEEGYKAMAEENREFAKMVKPNAGELLSDKEIALILDIAVNEKKSMLASRRDIAKAQLVKGEARHKQEIGAIGHHILEILDRREYVGSDTIRELRFYGQALKENIEL